jgi:hypothetical protein
VPKKLLQKRRGKGMAVTIWLIQSKSLDREEICPTRNEDIGKGAKNNKKVYMYPRANLDFGITELP